MLPTLLAEVDARAVSNAAEAKDGFALGRFRMGLRATPIDWLLVVGTIELVGTQPYLLDGYVVFKPLPWLELGAGWAKAPVFASFRWEPVHTMPFPDRAPVVTSLRTRRDLGAEIVLRPRRAPIEAVARIGNGGGTIVSNDNRTPAGHASFDVVLGRAWTGGKRKDLGVRLGVAGMVEDAGEREGISGRNAIGFTFHPPPTILGLRGVGEAHAIAYLGPVRAVVEAGLARESVLLDDDDDPETPEVRNGTMDTYGLTTELAWVVRGLPREVGKAPRARAPIDASWDGGAVELAVRADRLALGRRADARVAGGATGAAVAAKWWPVDFLAVTLAGYAMRYDRMPIATGDRWSWHVMVRLSAFYGYPGTDWRFRVRRPKRKAIPA